MTQNRWLGLFFLLGSLLLIFVWIPLDTETGFIEKQRRQLMLGDALAPTVAGCLILFASILLIFEKASDSAGLTMLNLRNVAIILILVTISFAIMRYAGPIVAYLYVDGGYRPLRATAPWTYVGFVIGGSFLVFALISFVERKMRWRRLVLAIIAVGLIAAFYDVPFDNLLLPPNGDV